VFFRFEGAGQLTKKENPAVVPNKWFEKRRDFFVRKVIEEFFLMHRSFQEVYAIYVQCRIPYPGACSDIFDRRDSREKRAQIWDRMTQMVGSENKKGPLWRLKDLCHLVWPEERQGYDGSGILVDWLVGSIFHEAMKLKENVYLLNRYGPAANKMKEQPLDMPVTALSAQSPVPRLENMIDVQGVINRAAADVVRQMEQIAFLFNLACYMLRVMLPLMANNMLVVRLLIEREKLMRRFWGEQLEDVFRDMFYGDEADGFCRAGRSYLGAQWFPQALNVYKRALAANPTCDEAITRVVQLQQIVSENKELLGVA